MAPPQSILAPKWPPTFWALESPLLNAHLSCWVYHILALLHLRNKLCLYSADIQCFFGCRPMHIVSTTGVANLWRISYLKVAHCTFLMTSHFCSPIFYYFFYLHSTDIFQWKTKHLRAWKPIFIFCSPPTLSVENRTSEGIGARRGATVPYAPPLCPCNKVLKPNFQPIISQTNNGCSLLSFILAKLLLLDISCQNIFALSVVPALTARPFSIKKSVLKWLCFSA